MKLITDVEVKAQKSYQRHLAKFVKGTCNSSEKNKLAENHCSSSD